MGTDVIEGDAGDWVRWAGGGIAAFFALAGGFIWRRIDSLERELSENITALARKLDSLGKQIGEHALEDERQFAKKDDLRRLADEVSRKMDDILARQDRNLGAILDRLDRLRGNNGGK